MAWHNPIGYAHGLLDELAASLRIGRHDHADEVRAELNVVRPEVAKVNPDGLDDDGKVEHARLLKRLAELDAPTPAVAADVPTGESAVAEQKGRARTTKATAAPERAVPPGAA